VVWFVENVLMFFLVNIFCDYILIFELFGGGELFMFEGNFFMVFRNVVNMRNGFVYCGIEIDVDCVKLILLVVCDVLWMFDIFCGYDWV